MPSVEVSLPDRVDEEIDSLVEQGEFINRDQAIEELLSRGIAAYNTNESSSEEVSEDLFTQVVEDQTDPAIEDDPESSEYR